jgi:CRP-like cAMP-binding protein
MDFNLILTAQTLVLAPHVRESAPIDGMLVVKNIPAKTYLHVTKAQWVLLQQFRQPRTVPVVLGYALEERLCPPLNEFFELMLKAVRANILLKPDATAPEVKPTSWRGTVRPQAVAHLLLLLFLFGLGLTLCSQPGLPKTYLDALAGFGVLSAALSLGSLIAASIIRGAGGEVYRPRWTWLGLPPHFTIDRSDTVMLPPVAQLGAIMAGPAMLATATGLLASHRPAWNLPPLIGLALSLRPILGGRVATLFRLGRGRRLSDAEHGFVFPPNLRPRVRWQLLVSTLSHPETWVKLVYGVGWTLAIVYLAGRLTEVSLWKIDFWEANGLRLGLGIGGSLLLVAVLYLGWELLKYARTRVRHRRQEFRLWQTRWFGGRKFSLDEGGRVKFASSSPLFRTLAPTERQALARVMQPAHHRARQWLVEYGPKPTHAALIVSGRVGLYRVLPSGRTTRVNLLSEGDVVGLQDLADPGRPEYRVRALTPVTLLKVDRATIERDLVESLPKEALTDIVLKRPFLRQIPLCRNWQPQAIERFAQLSTVMDCKANGLIVEEGALNHHFFIIFEHRAAVMKTQKQVAVIHAGEFFGEIGLLQNSTATATIAARPGTRCLSISRPDFLRFVTHSHLVALELERVSSQRLGRPIFPLETGNFRIM